ncbi:MAG: hypothetical protein OXL33_01955 [Chloroflexota bacterium]|nr:hypothetical protein [Chloroflexota bacterium]
MVDILGRHGVEFDWPEKNRDIPRVAMERFEALSEPQREALGVALTESVIGPLNYSVCQVLDTDISTVASQVSGVEVLLRTNRQELLLRSYASVSETLAGLVEFMSDSPDISDHLQ